VVRKEPVVVGGALGSKHGAESTGVATFLGSGRREEKSRAVACRKPVLQGRCRMSVDSTLAGTGLEDTLGLAAGQTPFRAE